MSPETVVEVACWVLTVAAALAIAALRNPDSRLSRYVDRLDAADRKARQ